MKTELIDILNTFSSVLPIIITGLLVIFTLTKKFFEERVEREFSISNEIKQSRENKDGFDKIISSLIPNEKTDLRLLEELYKEEQNSLFLRVFDRETSRTMSLRDIQSSLRKIMKANLESENFPQIRDQCMSLIDLADDEIRSIQERKPFDGLEEPEKSLLADLLEELPHDKPMPKQKALQLADIIKIKHQDTLRLQKENAKATAWTKWGTAGTIFFGVLSILLSIYVTR